MKIRFEHHGLEETYDVDPDEEPIKGDRFDRAVASFMERFPYLVKVTFETKNVEILSYERVEE